MIPDRSEHDVHETDDAVILRARTRAKAAWAASMREDDRLHRAASEKRLAASWPRPRVLPVRSFVMGAAAACCAMLLVLAVWRSIGSRTSFVEASAPATAARTGAVGTGTATAAGASGSSATSAASLVAVPTSALPGAPNVDARLATRAMVVIGACPECRVGGAKMEPGVTVALGRALSVPRGSRITLGFAMDELVDPAVGVDVEGPAEATSPDPQTLALDRGSARFRGLRDVVVRVPGGVVESTGATFTVRVDAQGVAHVAVESGRVVVTSQGTHDTREVQAGAAAIVAKAPTAEAVSTANGAAARGSASASATAASVATANASTASTPTASTPAAADDSADAVSRARARFHDGDATGARRQLEALTHASDAALARRASFTLAEIEMASGERDQGRARLAELTTAPDPRLASDAATLLARSETTAAGRADAWGRYLATSPPTAYRDRALLERAEALVDAGRTNEANAILSQLRGATLTEAQQRQLARLSSKANERH